MYGWRGRIGYISPAPVDSVAYEFYRIVPEGVALVTNSLMMQHVTLENIEKVLAATLGAAQELAEAGADLIVSAGGPAVTTKGIGSDRKLIQQIEQHVGRPATTTTTAALEALHRLQAKRLAVATPYIPDFADKLKTFLEDSGFEVGSLSTMDKTSNYQLSLVPPHVIYRHAKQTFLECADADAIYIPCARWAAVHVIQALEDDLGVPVVTSQQAWIWAGLRHLNVKKPVRGFGRLFEL